MEEKLRRVLAKRKARRIKDKNRELSAVLVPIYCKDGECYLVFTMRTEGVKVHKGQISFPGGAYQEGDASLLNTALRECAEEIGLPADSVEILGALDDITTQTSSYVISPFVALIPWPHEFKVNAEEIQEIIEAPVSALLDNIRQGTEVIKGQPVAGHFCHYQGRVIWGATAAILSQFLDVFTRATGG